MALAKTVFTTGIEEKLAVMDVYGQSTANVLAGASSALSEFDVKSLSSMLGGNKGPFDSILTSFSPNIGLTLDADTLKTNMLSTIPGAGGMLGGMSDKISAGVLSGSAMSSITATMNGVSSIIDKADLSSLSNLSGMMGEVCGANFPISLQDNAGMSMLGSNLLKQAASLNIPQAYTQFVGGLGSNMGMITSITKQILPSIVSSSNLNMLAEVARGPIGKSINQLVPGFTSSFLNSFKPSRYPAARGSSLLSGLVAKPLGANSSNLLTDGLKLFTSLSSIQSSWNKTTPPRNRNQPVVNRPPVKNNYAPLQRSSSSALSLVKACANMIATPTILKPTVVKRQLISQLPNPATEFPHGTSSVSQSNHDGSTTLIYTLPNGTVVTRNRPSDASLPVISSYAYPAQMQGAPAPREWGAEYLANIQAVNYPSTQAERDVRVLDNLPTNYSDFGQTSYGVGSYATSGQGDNSSTFTRVNTSSGGSYTCWNYADGSEEYVTLAPTSASAYSFSDDPFANWAANTAADPIRMSAAMNDFYDQGQAYEFETQERSYFTMNAKETLVDSFPMTYFGDFSSDDFWG